MNTKIFDMLALAAIDSEHPWARLAAAVVYRNKIVAVGKNRNKTHPFQKRFASNPDAIYPHAEIEAIRTALKIVSVEEIEGMDLYVCRMKKTRQNGPYKHGLAKPCEGCTRALVTFGIKNVYYTTDTHNVIETL